MIYLTCVVGCLLILLFLFLHFKTKQNLYRIKYNCENGGPAPDELTTAIYEKTTAIKSYKICKELPEVDISKIGATKIDAADGSSSVTVEVISATENHVNLLKTVFDFGSIKSLLDRPDFTMVYDAMHGVNGPYVKTVFVDELGQPEDVAMNAVPPHCYVATIVALPVKLRLLALCLPSIWIKSARRFAM